MRTEKPGCFMPRFRVRRESGWKLPAMLHGSREYCENTITNCGSETPRRSVPPWCGSRKLVSYLGLNPSEDSSAGRQRLGAISRVENLCAHAGLVARLTE